MKVNNENIEDISDTTAKSLHFSEIYLFANLHLLLDFGSQTFQYYVICYYFIVLFHRRLVKAGI